MPRREPALGDCPECSAAVPTSQLIARCGRDDWPAVLAACPDCGEAIHPE